MTIPSSPLVPSSYHIARSTCTRRLSRRWTSATSSHSIRTGVAASVVVGLVNRSRTTGSALRESHRRTPSAVGAAQPVEPAGAASAEPVRASAEEAAAEEAAAEEAAAEEAAEDSL